MKKFFKWEFWPFWFFYIPIYFYWFWLSLRARSFVFFSAANPVMNLGGFAAYSKYNVLEKIPKRFLPKTLFIPTYTPYSQVEQQLTTAGIDFPLIIKPDVGERGFGVEKITTATALQAHLQQYQHLALIIQEYVDFPLELGVMYYRLPDEPSGQISSVVEKEFLQVTGDGDSTLAQLFRQNKRTNYHFDMLATQYANELQDVLPAGAQKDLVSIGNHSRGTTFLNANHLITPQLIDVFDEISRSVTGYYFGRYDLRVSHLDDLYAGRNIKVLELNGANSEPAHIYDPQMPLWQAYKDLFKHWKALYQVSVQNHRKGVAYAPLGETVRKIRRYFKERRVRRD